MSLPTLSCVYTMVQLLEVVCVAFEPMAVEDVFSIVGMASLSLHARSNILAKLSAVLVTLRGKFVPYVLQSHEVTCSCPFLLSSELPGLMVCSFLSWRQCMVARPGTTRH